MKKILSSPSPYDISALKEMLESAGIACITRNEVSAGYANDIAFGECIPELWVAEDAQMEKALQIKEVWKSPDPVSGSAWSCPKCGESCEPQFTSCWKCGAAKAA